MQVLDVILEKKISDKVTDYIYYELETYKKYLSLIKKLSLIYEKCFLETLKQNELINNHETEHENKFLRELNLNLALNNGKQTSIDIVRQYVIDEIPLDLNNFCQVHRILIHGTPDDITNNYEIRKSDVRVSYYDNEREVIQYIPPCHEKIILYLQKLFEYTENISNNNELDILYKPILEHFYIVALQPFNNGNTRLARLIEYGQIFRLTRKYLDSTLPSPALFMSKNYLLTGKVYRDIISELVQNPIQDNIDKWIIYNLHAIDEQIYFCKNNVKKLLK